jgi:glycogen operon protein
VVYNHTAEGNHLGPTLSLKGIDNSTYYRLTSENPRFYKDYTGTGNTLNMLHPRVLQLVMDSLRYWVLEMHVDGFRFDLAATLARELHDVNRLGTFLDIIHQDPILSQVKLIAEPWDLGEGGYQVGNFPVGWAEWNDRYRDTVRSYWKGDSGVVGDLAYRITGSSDLYAHSGRRPYASVNFITAHDGFTLQDLVSYNDKHNEANGEDNRDGNNNNRSWNCGAEGPTEDPDILALRAKQKRNLLATLLLSQGVPMIYGGDAIGHTQMGNNNAYCQDNPTSWLNWNLQPADRDLLAFVQRIISLRQRHPVFRRRRFFQGRPIKGASVKDVLWLNPSGNEMSEEEWRDPSVQCLGMYLSGQGLDETDERGHKVIDENFLVLLNAYHEDVQFSLPAFRPDDCWIAWMDTSREGGLRPADTWNGGLAYPLQARSMVVLMERRNGKKEEANEAPS